MLKFLVQLNKVPAVEKEDIQENERNPVKSKDDKENHCRLRAHRKKTDLDNPLSQKSASPKSDADNKTPQPTTITDDSSPGSKEKTIEHQSTDEKELMEAANKDRLPTSSNKVCSDVTFGSERITIPAFNDTDNENDGGLNEFTYTDSLIFRTKEGPHTEMDVLCDCEKGGSCSSGVCFCELRSDAPVYNDEGLLNPNTSCIDRDTIIECGPKCPCSPTDCRLRVTQRGLRYKLEVYKTADRGWGLRSAEQYIPRGAFIAEYIGEVLDTKTADKRDDDGYIFEHSDSEGLCVDARIYGNYARFINHSCDPNLEAVKVVWGKESLKYAHICLFTSSEIAEGDELFFDYTAGYWTQKKDEMYCRCGTAECNYSSKEKILEAKERLKQERKEEKKIRQQLNRKRTKQNSAGASSRKRKK